MARPAKKPKPAPEATFHLTPFQQQLLLVPQEYDVALLGGRGGGKSYAMAILALRHAELYRSATRILFVRQTYRGLGDFEQITRDIFTQAYGVAARFNAAEHTWKLPGGAYFELGQLEGVADYPKYQGRSFNMLLIDEAGQYPTPDLLDRLRSNLRGPQGIPVRCILAGNPGDAGHGWLSGRFAFKAAPWMPFFEPKSGREWVFCPSTYRDNDQIDRDTYRAQLEASCPNDRELLKAWTEGDWSIVRGAYFATVLDEARNAIDPWPTSGWRERREWRFFLAHDFGVSAPSVTYVVGISPGAQGADGRWYPRDSVVLLDELATCEPDSLTRGLGWTIPRLAEEICALAKRWKMPASGVADDACFAKGGHAAGSIAEEFRAHKVYWRAARKASRQTGWEKMRRLLADAGKPDVPGLFVSRNCTYWWASVPYLGRDPKRADDVDSRQADHAADATRYAITGMGAGAGQGGVMGLF
ncbi:MAG: phage terminase large subunit [Pseudomonadota bacterium]|nr:phage terminase large subunit [Pseudomonadota bacterium]